MWGLRGVGREVVDVLVLLALSLVVVIVLFSESKCREYVYKWKTFFRWVGSGFNQSFGC